MEKTGLELLVVGDTAIDSFYEVEKIPRLNSAAEVVRHQQFYGGMGANTAVVAGALGIKTGLVSVIGTDAEDYKKYLENIGIRLFLKGIFGETTKSIFFKQADEHISFFYHGVTAKLDELDVRKDLGLNREVLSDVGCVYMARTYLNLQAKISSMCKKKFVVYNPGYGVFKFKEIPEVFYGIIKNVDVLVINHHELQHLKKLGFVPEAHIGNKTFLVTKGSRGCSIHTKSTQINVPIYQTNYVDTSGAGDAFNAGFIAARLRNYEVYDAVKIGNATASFIVEKWGCQTNLPRWDSVMERYKKI